MNVNELLHSQRIRKLLLLLALVVGLVMVWQQDLVLYTPGWGGAGSHDFIEYWASARLLLQGGNPYGRDEMLAVEQGAGWPGSMPVLMWNPPWTLALVLPLALLPFGIAALAWLLIQFVLILGSGALLWRYFAPKDGRAWIGLLLAAGFAPGLFALRMGQVSPWLLVGVTLFLWAVRRRRDFLAGGALALLLIKPHVAYLFLLAALWWAWQSQRRRILISWLAVPVAAGSCVLLFAPDVWANYLAAALQPPVYWATPTLGMWFRFFLGTERSWLQFLPSLMGIFGLVVWLVRRRGPWRWEHVTAPLLLVSVVTAAYGWEYDQLVLLPVVVDMVSRLRLAARGRQAAVAVGLVISQLVLVVQYRSQMRDLFYLWHPLALAGLYGWVARWGIEPGGHDS
jgi:hypothetical protein